MKNTFIASFALCAFLLTGCVSALKPGVAQTTCSGLEAFIVSNGIVATTVVPEASGVCTDIRCGDQFFTPPLVYTSSEVDPLLPPYCSQSPAGGRSELWTQRIMTQIIPKADQQPFCVAPDGTYTFRMVKNYWKGRMLLMERTISILPGETRIVIDTQATNTGKAVESVGLWENFCGRIGKAGVHDEILFPCKGNVARVGNRGVELFPQDTLYVKNAGRDSRTIDLAPAEPWVARRLPNHPLFVISIPDGLGKDGFFYTNCFMPDGHTSEPVHETVQIKPGEKTSMRVEYLMFPGMDNLRGLCKDIAVDLAEVGDALEITIGTVRKTAPGALTIQGIGTVNVPEIIPGKPARVSLPLSRKNVTVPLQASFENYGAFTIFPR